MMDKKLQMTQQEVDDKSQATEHKSHLYPMSIRSGAACSAMTLRPSATWNESTASRYHE